MTRHGTSYHFTSANDNKIQLLRQGKVTLLTTLADTIKAEKEEADKKFSSEIDNLKKESEEKTNEVAEKVKLIGRVRHCYSITFPKS